MIDYVGLPLGKRWDIVLNDSDEEEIDDYLAPIYGEDFCFETSVYDKYVIHNCQKTLDTLRDVTIKHAEVHNEFLIYPDDDGGMYMDHHIKIKLWTSDDVVMKLYIIQNEIENFEYCPLTLLDAYFVEKDFVEDFRNLPFVKRFALVVFIGTLTNFHLEPQELFYICKELDCLTNTNITNIAVYNKLDKNTVKKEGYRRTKDINRKSHVMRTEGKKYYVFYDVT